MQIQSSDDLFYPKSNISTPQVDHYSKHSVYPVLENEQLFWRRNNRCRLSSRIARCYHTRRLITKWSHPTLTHPWVWNRIRGVSTMSARLLLGGHWIINLYRNYTLTYMTIRVQNAISESHLERTLQSFSPKNIDSSLLSENAPNEQNAAALMTCILPIHLVSNLPSISPSTTPI